jgi:DNA polymerase III alpha subunit
MNGEFIYQNYHKHSHYSNPITPDSAVDNEAYAKRAKELGHGIIASGEHGWQGYYYETFELAKKYGLKFIFSTEAYWVKNRFEPDNTNSHIVLIAKNENGRRAINSVLSEANITGYYYKPRLDLELLLSLPSNDVFVTTACGFFWKYEDIEDILVKLHNHFKTNLMLEVQYHHTDIQKSINERILELSKKYNIDYIMGCDSHYIYPEDAKERENVLEAKGIRYDDENGWFMDYPSGEEVYKRFKQQGILSDEEIVHAMKNTNVILEFDNIEFDKKIKLPTLYPDKTQEERDNIFIKLINERWNAVKDTIPKEKHLLYMEEITKEVKCVIDTKMADYFLIDYHLVKNAVKKGGIITRSGRGSGVSFYINKLLGFTNVDRISAKVHMYPERFMSTTRILETVSLPDLDLNLGNPEVFAEAQTELLGEGHSYPMCAFGTFKTKSAFKLYAKSQNLDFDVANEISQQIEKFEKALSYADDDEKDLILIEDYVDSEYLPLIEESKKYQGIISDKKAHPCGYLLYSGDIKSEIGLIKCKSESTGKETITTVVDGAIAEKYKFLKNDLLKVDVVLVNKKVYDRIGIEPLTIDELLQKTYNNKKVWDIYAKGFTACINQTEQDKTKQKVANYCPTNISELTAFIAGIRPSFKSMYDVFEKRVPFSYEVKAFDKLLQTEELPFSFVLYQEQIMATLSYAGFPSGETYTIMKAISKKKEEIILPLKDRFIKGFGDRIKEEEPYLSNELIYEKCIQVWTIIENSVAYGFNASHAYCVSCDSLDGAYLKAEYPYEFYEVMLNHYAEKGNKDKIASLVIEMQKGFDIKLGQYKFRADNRGFKSDKENHVIYPSLKSIKYLNQQVANELYELSKTNYDTFIDLLIDILENTSCNSKQLKILILLDYFSEFGNSHYLETIYDYFCDKYKKTHCEKTKIKRKDELISFMLDAKIKSYTPDIKMKTELEYLDHIETTVPSLPKEYYMIADISKKYTHPMVTLYCMKDGLVITIKCKNKYFDKNPFKKFDIIKVAEIKQEFKYKKSKTSKTGFEKTDQLEDVLARWVIVE